MPAFPFPGFCLGLLSPPSPGWCVGKGARSWVQPAPTQTILSANLGHLPHFFVCCWHNWYWSGTDGLDGSLGLCEGPSSSRCCPGRVPHQVGQRDQMQRRKFSLVASGPSRGEGLGAAGLFWALLCDVGRIAASTLLRNGSRG